MGLVSPFEKLLKNGEKETRKKEGKKQVCFKATDVGNGEQILL